jgi:hypothetical protein
MNKTLLSLILVALIAAPLTAFGNVASARAASINTAIRGTTNSTVYWYANDGKRYVFPNAATYYTWFTGFENVQTITDSELFSIPLAGNVTYRPGAKLVKVTTDPKVYAVARGGMLRHVSSESLAIQLYGYDWASKVQDVPDEFFTNYTVGSPIYSTTDYNVSNEYNGVFSPSDSLRTQGQNNNGSQNNSLTLTADRTSITSGQAVYLTGTYFGTLPSGGYLEIKDVRNSNTIKTCTNTSTCNVTVYPTIDSTQTSVQYYIVAKNNNGTHLATQYGQVIYTNGSSQNGSLTLTSDRTNVTNGQQVNLYANYNANIPSGARMEIKEVRTNNVVKTCYNVASCSTAIYPYQSGYSSTQYIVVVIDTNGNQIATQNGPTIYFDGSNGQTGTLTLTSDRTNITSGQSVTLNANYNNSLNGGRIEIKETRTNTIVKSCYDTTYCTVTVYPYQTGYSSTQYVATVFNNSGSQIATQYGSTIYFDGTNNQNGNRFIKSVSRTSVNNGGTVTFTATLRDTVNLASGYSIEIIDPRSQSVIGSDIYFTGYVIQTCWNTTVCTASASISNYMGRTGLTFGIRLRDSNGNVISTEQFETVYVTDGSSGNGSSNNDGTNYINGLTLQSDRTSVDNGGMVKLTANAYNAGNWSYVGNRIEIRDIRTGSTVRSCYDQSWCVVDLAVTGVNGTAQYEARIYDRNNNFIMSQFGPVIYVNGSSNNGGNTYGAPTITYPTNNQVLTNNPRTLNIAWNGSARRHQVEVTCSNGCWPVVGQNTNTAYLTTENYNNFVNTQMTGDDNITIRVRTINDDGSYGTWSNSVSFRFNTSGSVGQIPNTDIYIAPSTNVRAGGTVYLTASFTNLPYNSANTVIRLYTEQSSTPVGTCSGSVSCSVPYTISTSGVNTRVYGVASNSSLGNTIETARIPLATF